MIFKNRYFNVINLYSKLSISYSKFDKGTYVTGSYRLNPQPTECKHFLKDLAFNSPQDRICLRNSLGGSKPFLSHPSIKLGIVAFLVM